MSENNNFYKLLETRFGSIVRPLYWGTEAQSAMEKSQSFLLHMPVRSQAWVYAQATV